MYLQENEQKTAEKLHFATQNRQNRGGYIGVVEKPEIPEVPDIPGEKDTRIQFGRMEKHTDGICVDILTDAKSGRLNRHGKKER